MKRALASLLCLAIAGALASPAAAHDVSADRGCRAGASSVGVAAGYTVDRNGDLGVCRTLDGREFDNHVAHGGGGGGWTEEGCREGDFLAGVEPANEADR